MPKHILRSLTNCIGKSDQMAARNQQVADDDILALFRESNIPMTAPELAQDLPITRQGVHKRLKQMAEDGDLRKKETGSATIYWLPEMFPRE